MTFPGSRRTILAIRPSTIPDTTELDRLSTARPPRQAHIILNPISGDGRGGKLRPSIERELTSRGVEFELAETQGPRHATELARRKAADGVDAIVAVGGDGTAHEVANGLLQARRQNGADGPALAVLPVGTGNDFVKMLGLYKRLDRAYDVVAHAPRRRFDVGLARWDGGEEYFINGAGTGIDVEVVRQILKMRPMPGVLKYLNGVLRAVVRFQAIPLRVHVGDRLYQDRMMMVAVGNGRCIGGGFWVTPEAEPDNGLLDILMISKLNYPQIAAVIPKVMRGKHMGVRQVTMARHGEIRIEAGGDEPLFFQLDGELHEPAAARELRITVQPAALTVLAAEQAPV